MGYKLNVTEHAHELLDNLVYHLIYCLKTEQAAKHLLDSIDVIYDRLEVNPFQFSECRDAYLAKKGYREAVVPQMNYIIIFDVRADVVNVVGIFHQLENYPNKLYHHRHCNLFRFPNDTRCRFFDICPGWYHNIYEKVRKNNWC